MTTRRKPDPLTREFSDHEQGADFWDSHDTADYKDIMEPVSFKATLSHRHCLVELDEKRANILLAEAQKKGMKPAELASELLRKTLVGFEGRN